MYIYNFENTLYVRTCTNINFYAEAVVQSASSVTQRYVLQLTLVLLCFLLTLLYPTNA